MRSFFTIAALATILPAVFSAPTQMKAVKTVNGPKKANSYIITLKAGSDHKPVVAAVKGSTKVYTNFNGFAAELDEQELNKLRADADVELIEEDGIMRISAIETQTDAPWGIARTSGEVAGGDVADLAFTYKYDSSAGEGVDVYVIDTGINTAHTQFGGRAKWGTTFGGYEDQDGNGHGTHCAGTVGSKQFGIAKNVNLIAVKVLGDDGSGATSDIVSGLDWVLSQSKATGKPSVVSMSLGGPASSATDNVVATLTEGGVHVVVAAGNESSDAGETSPARAPSAITVGASDITDAFADFSNYGKVVDVIAPGVDILSTYKGSNAATASLSGTSMATPHVAGLVALLIGKNGNGSPAEIAQALIDASSNEAVSGVPSGTVNKLAQNSF